MGHRADHLPNTTFSNYVEPGTLVGSYGNADPGNPLHRAAIDPTVGRRVAGEDLASVR